MSAPRAPSRSCLVGAVLAPEYARDRASESEAEPRHALSVVSRLLARAFRPPRRGAPRVGAIFILVCVERDYPPEPERVSV